MKVRIGCDDLNILFGFQITKSVAGDFSFTRSLVEHHGCRHVTATCFDSPQELSRKYPQATETTSYLIERGQRIIYNIDATKLSHRDIRRPPPPPATPVLTHYDIVEDLPTTSEDADDESFTGFSDEEPAIRSTDHERYTKQTGPRGWDLIAFNFPHVGGKSTDVNRQVRHNQLLLVSFFEAALPLLTPPCSSHPVGGAVLVTLFEGEPYTLWNIKDLGRHAGLRSERSWKFDWSAYPGYRHARTIGNIEGGRGWRGEERAARTYAFVTKDAPSLVGPLFSHSASETAELRKEKANHEEDD